MAKKPKNMKRKSVKKFTVARGTAVRRSPIPRAIKKRVEAAPKVITFEMIAERAYLISISGNCGSQDENWHRAERELRSGI